MTWAAALLCVLLSCMICLESDPPPVDSGCAHRTPSESAADADFAEQADCVDDEESPQVLLEAGEGSTVWESMWAGLAEFGWRSTDEEPDESALVAMGAKAESLSSQQKWAEAERIQWKVLAARRRVLGAEHPTTLNALGAMAAYVSYQRKDVESERLHRLLLAVERRVRGEEHPETLATMHNLAFCLSNLGKHVEAEQIYRQLIPVKVRLFGPETPETLDTVRNLAQLLRDQWKTAEAEVLFLQMLEVERRIFGLEHAQTLITSSHLAVFLLRQGKFAETEMFCRDLLAIMQRVLGPHHASTLITTSNLAMALIEQDKFAEGMKLYRLILALQRRTLGAEHQSTLATENYIAMALASQGSHAAAEKSYQKLLVLSKRVFGPTHAETLGILQRLEHLRSCIKRPETVGCKKTGALPSFCKPIENYERTVVPPNRQPFEDPIAYAMSQLSCSAHLKWDSTGVYAADSPAEATDAYEDMDADWVESLGDPTASLVASTDSPAARALEARSWEAGVDGYVDVAPSSDITSEATYLYEDMDEDWAESLGDPTASLVTSTDSRAAQASEARS